MASQTVSIPSPTTRLNVFNCNCLYFPGTFNSNEFCFLKSSFLDCPTLHPFHSASYWPNPNLNDERHSHILLILHNSGLVKHLCHIRNPEYTVTGQSLHLHSRKTTCTLTIINSATWQQHQSSCRQHRWATSSGRRYCAVCERNWRVDVQQRWRCDGCYVYHSCQ